MRAPDFWSRPPGLAARALAPLAAIFGAVAARRLARAGERAPVPVICLGNFTLGGAGKTPAALLTAERLAALGARPAFLSRGYRGALSGPTPLRVDPDRHTAAEVGDEPLLLARCAPTIVCADRPAGARAAVAAGANVIVMDDGLQNPALVKDLAFAVVDGATGIGSGLCPPAGPLRAPMPAQWPLAQALLVVGPGAPGEALALEAARRGLPTLLGRIALDRDVVASLAGDKLLAFAGIGRPEKFFRSLAEAGLEARETVAYADHRPYAAAEIATLAQRAAAQGLRLVTTEKDFVRLDAAARAAGALAGLTAIPARLDLVSGDLDALLTAALAARASGAAGGR